MAKHMRYDKDGNEVYFNHAVDAREGVQMGFFFETPPEKEVEKKAEKEPIKEFETKPSKKKAEKEALEDSIIIDDIKIENINLDDEN